MPESILQRTKACYQRAEAYYGRSFPRPQIRLDLRGQAAGAAYVQHNLLRFNARLYRENAQHFLQHTVAHEVAHLLAYALHGRHIRPHGPQWQAIMEQVFHLPAERCHRYALPPVWKTFYRYVCACKQHDLSPQRHGRITRGASYLCRHCGQSVEFSGMQGRQLVQR